MKKKLILSLQEDKQYFFYRNIYQKKGLM